MTDFERAIEPLVDPPDVVIRPPGSKSLTNRSLVLAALAEGPSILRDALVADDTAAMIDALRVLGSEITQDGTTLQVNPIATGHNAAHLRIDARLSGTTSRFILPVAALVGAPVVVDGQAPLRRRPMGPVLDALGELGATIEDLGEPGRLPIRIAGQGMSGGAVAVDASESSQFLSALLLIGPALACGLVVDAGANIAARPFVDLTVATLGDFGADVAEVVPGHFVVASGGLSGRDFSIEPDATTASYFLAAAAITGGRVGISGLTKKSIQGDIAFADVLDAMGAQVEWGSDQVTVTGGRMHGLDVDLGAHPDIAQTFAAVAVFADSPSRVRGIGFIRGHETDRLAAVVAELRRLGIDAAETADGFVIEPGTPQPGTVVTYADHRMAMSFALLGLAVPGIRIANPDVVDKTYPAFWQDLDRLRSGSSKDSPGRLPIP